MEFRLTTRVGAVLMLLYVATVASVPWYFPSSNWDMVAYVASVLDTGDLSVTEVHRQSWDNVRENVSEGDFLVLTSDRPYRIHQYADAQSFYSMLGFYKVKFLYVETATFISNWMSPIEALRIVSIVSTALIGLTMFYWLSSQNCLFLAPLVIALLALTGFGRLALFATPDAFASLFILLAAVFYMKRMEALLALSLFLAFLARPDHLAFIGILAVASLVSGGMRRGAMLALLAALVSYPLITNAAGHPGWWVQMWFTHIEYVPTLVGFDPDFSIAVYIEIVVRATVRSLVDENWPAVVIFQLFFCGLMANQNVKFTTPEVTLLAVIFLTIGAKFFLFPLHETRFHFAYVAVGGLILITILGRHMLQKAQISSGSWIISGDADPKPL